MRASSMVTGSIAPAHTAGVAPAKSSGAVAHRGETRTLRRVRARAQRQDDRQQQEQQQVPPALVSALTAIGLAGTVGTLGAQLSGLPSPFAAFHWDDREGIALALQLFAPLAALEAVLFGPAHDVPDSLQTTSSSSSGGGSSSSSSSRAPAEQRRRHVDMAAVARCGAWSADTWRLTLALFPSVLQRPGLERLPRLAGLGLVLGREVGRELLQRGFVLSALAKWATDRLYEAGLDDSVALGPAAGGVELTLPQLGMWAASLAATALFSPAAFIAAEEAAEAASGALLLRTEAGQAALGPMLAALGGGDGGGAAPSQQQQQQQQEGAECGAGEEDGEEEEDEEEQLDPLVLEYRLAKATTECLGSAPVRLAHNVTLAKELGRLALSNAAFVATGGNLAATLAGGLSLNALLLAYGAARRGGGGGGGGTGAPSSAAG